MLQQIRGILYVNVIAEKFLSILLQVCISSCYFIKNARRDTTAEKELDIVIQMTLEHVLVQGFKKKRNGKKVAFNKVI